MKKTFYNLSLVLSALSIALASCSKDDDAAPAAKCNIAAIYSGVDTLSHKVEYSSDNKIIKIEGYNDAQEMSYYTTYTYSPNKAEAKDFDRDGNLEYTTVYLLGSNGFADISIHTYLESPTNYSIDSIFYTYDKEGYLTKKVNREYYFINSTMNFEGQTTYDYTITNGNRVKQVITYGNFPQTYTFEFNENLDLVHYDADPLIGKGNKNLVKKMTEVTTGSDDHVYNYSYELNSKGLPTTITMEEKQGNWTDIEKTIFEYSCK